MHTKTNYEKFTLSSVTIFISCDNDIRDAGHIKYSAVSLVCRETKEGILYGLKSHEKVCLPPLFKRIEYGADMFSVYVYPDNGPSCYLFSVDGVEVLTGRRSGAKKIGFEPLEIIGWQDMSAGADNYFNNMLADIGYVRYKLANGKTCLLYSYLDNPVVLGPHREIVPGCSGYMFQDDNGKWGVEAIQIREENYQGPKYRISPVALFDNRRFEEVIEVVKPAIRHYSVGSTTYTREYIWFVRNGSKWEAVDILLHSYGKGEIQTIAVDQKLLERAKACQLHDKCLDSGEWQPASKQRIGCQEASVAFL